MKHYVAIEAGNKTGSGYSFVVYRVKNNRLCSIATGKIHYGWTRGEQSEVLNVLADNGEVPKKYRNTYYEGKIREKVSIRYICPVNQK